MKVLLLTDIPPCKNYTAGIVLNELLGFLANDEYVLCSVVNPALLPEIPEKYSKIPHLQLRKPNEGGFRFLPGILGLPFSFFIELIQGFRVRFFYTKRILSFIRQQNVTHVWIVLQGQTMVRLADSLIRTSGVPVLTQVWDAFDWWLKSNHLDMITKNRLKKVFDRAVRNCQICATASWGMSKEYTKLYEVPNIPIIAGLSKDLIPNINLIKEDRENSFIIGMAGQFYAQDAWNGFIQALDSVGWEILGKKIIIRVLGATFQFSASRPTNFEYLGWRSQEETIQSLSNCDLLYLPYWFDQDFRRESETSFPSKLVTYFASACPVICHAPDYSSPSVYIKDNKAGYLCESVHIPNIIESLEIIISDSNKSEVIARQLECFMRDFELEEMRKSFYQFLSKS